MLLGTGPPDDSAVFAYVGRAMSHGLMVYTDVWDHKGPLLYYLEYVGARLDPKSTLGIGLLELVAWAFTFYLLYSIIASFCSYRVSIGIALFGLFFVTRFCEGGNLCESWALLPLAMAQYAVWRGTKGAPPQKWIVILSICFASIFWLRPNMAAFPAIAILLMLHQSVRSKGVRVAMRQLAIVVATIAALTFVTLVPLIYTHAAGEMFKAYFGYNASYSSSISLAVRFSDTMDLIVLLLSSGLAILGLVGWGFAIERPGLNTESVSALSGVYLTILLCSFPLELFTACLSGRNYSHYLLPLFPTMAVLAAWVLSEIEANMPDAAVGRALTIGILVGLMPTSLIAYAEDCWNTFQPPALYLRLADFVRHTTTAQDKITVVGGAEAAYVTYYSRRMAGSRFVYQYGLAHTANPQAATQRQQFLRDLTLNRPAVIISTNPVVGLLCSSELECRILNGRQPASSYGYDAQLIPELLRPLIASEYRQIADPRFEGTRVFVRRDLATPATW
jgi:hypothetical protein